jgi:hypothetical protein
VKNSDDLSVFELVDKLVESFGKALDEILVDELVRSAEDV